MRQLLYYVKGLYHTVPITTILKECKVSIYPERIEYRIPLYNMINNIKKPIIVNEKDNIIFIYENKKT